MGTGRILQICPGCGHPRARARGGEFAEAYYERTIQNTISLDEDKISAATRGLSMGVGFRVLQGEKTGFAFSDDLDFTRLKDAADTAALIASGGARKKPGYLTTLSPPSYYQVKVSPDTIAPTAKEELLNKANAVARAHDKRITQVRVGFFDINQQILIANSEGLYVEDNQTLTSLGASCSALEGRQRSRGYETKSGSYGYGHFDVALAEEQGRTAAEMAIRNLPAEDAPAGEFPIVIANGYGGIFFHEAIGHSLEGDGIRKKTSCFWDKLGQPIATPAVTLADDGSFRGGWRTVNVDDEGCIGQDTVLIDRGVCAAFIQDRLNAGLLKMFLYDSQTARKAGVRVNTIASRGGYQSGPSAGFICLIAENGKDDPASLFKGVKEGLLVTGMRGTGTDVTTGAFSVGCSGFWIADGAKTLPVDGVTLGGTTLDILKGIDKVADDLDMRDWVNSPSFRVAEITVGGRQA
jgi:TldD protein